MAADNGSRKGVKIYRASKRVDLQKSGFMETPTMTPKTQAALGQAVGAGASAGADTNVLVRQSPEEGGFSLVHCWFKPEYPLPRHSHDADCLYYVISGELRMGNQVLRAGDSFFVPADAPYAYTAGPDGVEVLEIRHDVDQFDMKITDAPSARWQAFADATAANRDRWTAATTSPTFSANEA
jgi:quercetin dioxygenase-like cupin family protein